MRFTFFRTVNGRYKPYKAGEETGVWLIPDDAVSASAGAETQGQQVASYILSLSPPAAADAPDTKTANGKAASSTDTALPDFIKPELQVMRVSNMTIGSLKRYSLTSDTPFAGSQYRLNQGIYSGTVTAHAKDWNYMLDNSRLELSRETLDFGDVLHVADYPGLHSSITGSINLIPNSTLLEINVNASNATTTISRDDGSVTGNYNITPSDWKTFSSLPTIQYLWVFLMTIATLLSFVRPKEG